jgi:hypothetical protein
VAVDRGGLLAEDFAVEDESLTVVPDTGIRAKDNDPVDFFTTAALTVCFLSITVGDLFRTSFFSGSLRETGRCGGSSDFRAIGLWGPNSGGDAVLSTSVGSSSSSSESKASLSANLTWRSLGTRVNSSGWANMELFVPS